MLEPKLQEAATGKYHVCFADTAHFVYGSFLSVLWCFARCFISSATGRSRFNVLGALNAVTHYMVTVTNTSYINAWNVAELFRELRKIHKEGLITVILDNAKYQRCYIAERAPHMFNIELLYLPPYSPNLNLIERAWKFIKKKELNNRSFSSFKLFQEAICNSIGKFSSEYREELDTLLTWNFQTF